MAGVTVPLHSAEHFYVVTEPFDGVRPDLPILRDPDGYTYFKEEVGGLVVGGFEPEAKPWVSPDADPLPVRVPAARGGLGALLGADGERDASASPRCGRPACASSTTARRASRPTTSSSSAPAPEVTELLRRRRLQLRRHRVGRRRRSGARRVDRRAASRRSDLTAVDIRRFARFNGNNQWLHDRVAEVLGLHYEIPWPNREMRTARPFRRSPLYHVLERRQRELRQQDGLGAGELLRPAGHRARRSSTPGPSRTGCPGSPPSTPTPARNVTVFDQTSFSKYLVVGPRRRAGAPVAVHGRRRRAAGTHRLHRACSTPAAPTSRTSPSRGSAPTEYLVVSSAATTERDQDHIRRQPPAGHARRRSST